MLKFVIGRVRMSVDRQATLGASVLSTDVDAAGILRISVSVKQSL